MINTSLFKLIIIFFLLIHTGFAFAGSWSYLGFARVSTDTIFYIFVLNEKGANPEEQKILQKHVFSIPQKLKNGRTYNSILMNRTLNCKNKNISTDKAVFSNGVGSNVGTYENKSADINFESIGTGQDINLYLFDKYCPGQ